MKLQDCCLNHSQNLRSWFHGLQPLQDFRQHLGGCQLIGGSSFSSSSLLPPLPLEAWVLLTSLLCAEGTVGVGLRRGCVDLREAIMLLCEQVEIVLPPLTYKVHSKNISITVLRYWLQAKTNSMFSKWYEERLMFQRIFLKPHFDMVEGRWIYQRKLGRGQGGGGQSLSWLRCLYR